ncbi:MAG: peptidoglycan-associated lipoprotein Pal [Alphaproteobacteria bacterium]|nr:peptidoglycan-associated lipoprotein Pal [Alphaproteobacteria bacterium]
MKRLSSFVLLLGAGLALAACSSTPESDGTGAGTGTGTGGGSSAITSGGAGRAVAPGENPFAQEGVADRVLFETDRSDLTPDAQATLSRQAAWFGRNPSVRAVIEGHCDERGTREYNFALGERRAKSVIEFLKARGVAAARLRMVSFGKERPAALGASEDAWSQNRRAQTVVE